MPGPRGALLDRAYQEVAVLEQALADAFTPAEHATLNASWTGAPPS
ncbi:hypothetical protein ACGFZK_00010 [Streptomyces sp. NPDC048257]